MGAETDEGKVYKSTPPRLVEGLKADPAPACCSRLLKYLT